MTEVSDAVRRDIEAFIYLEARLADESRYDEWEALLGDEMHYWVPHGCADYDPAGALSYINDNRARLSTRLRQLKTGLRRAQTPPSPMRRSISNLEILEADDAAGAYTVAANVVIYEYAAQSSGALRLWPCRTTWRLGCAGGELKMCGKTVELVAGDAPQPNLTFLI